jgi:alpha-L-fucosidase 2
MYDLFPGMVITPAGTPELAEAAKVSLRQRGKGTTGFGISWQAACWARLFDGDYANLCLANQVAIQTCANLFSKCFNSPQVDGSFGATAAIAEMLLQSHGGDIHLLPALPKAWHEGTVTGLRARGGVEVDMVWQSGKLVSATLSSPVATTCTVRSGAKVVTCPLNPRTKLMLNAELLVQ